MSEREQIKAIVRRLNREVYFESDEVIEFDGYGSDSIVVEFDSAGRVTCIY